MERDLCHQRNASPRFVAERGTRVQEAAARRELHAEKWEGFQQARPQAFRCHGCRCPDPERADSIHKVPARRAMPIHTAGIRMLPFANGSKQECRS